MRDETADAASGPGSDWEGMTAADRANVGRVSIAIIRAMKGWCRPGPGEPPPILSGPDLTTPIDAALWPAIFLALHVMARDLSVGQRQACVDELEGVLADFAEDAAAVLFTRPLPPQFDVDAALALVLGPRSRAFLEELRRVQPSVDAVWSSWSRVPEARFHGADRSRLTATLARGRWFLGLVRAHASATHAG